MILQEQYFPHTSATSVSKSGIQMIKIIEESVVGSLPPDYLAKIKNHESLSEEEEEEVVIRGGLFKRLVPQNLRLYLLHFRHEY